MTQQYQQRNINNPEGGGTIANTVADPDAELTASDVGKVVRFDTTEAAGTVTLPRSAEAGDGAEITVIFPVGATGNPGTLAAISSGTPDVLVAPATAPANPAVSDNASFIVRADGGSNWYIVAGLA